MTPLINALVQKWFIAAIVFVLGIIVAIVLYAGNVAGLMGYVATAQLRLIAPSAPGVDLPCTPDAAAVLAKYAPSTSLPASSIEPSRITTERPAQGLLTVHYTGYDPENAVSGVNSVADRLTSFCASQTRSVTSAAQQGLAQARASLATELGPLDTQTGAVKDRAALAAQRDGLNSKLVGLQATSDDAQKQLTALIPIARSEIEQADPSFVALKKRFETDLDTYASVAAAYRPTYSRVIGLQARVATDRQQLQARRDELALLPLELSATYRTALATANQAQTSVNSMQVQITAISAQIAHYDKVIGPSGGTAAAQQEALGKAYQNIATNEANVRVTLAQIPSGGPVSVLSTTTADQVVRVGVLRSIALSLIVAVLFLLIGIVLAILIGLLDQRLLTIPQFTKLYGKPVIATLSPKQ